METKLIVGVVALAFVVAVVASMAMMSVTGNPIRSFTTTAKPGFGVAEMYTKMEIDNNFVDFRKFTGDCQIPKFPAF